MNTDESFNAPSPREMAILLCMKDGLSNKQIADKLQLSDKTVKNYLANLYSKLGVHTRTEAVWKALDLGMLRPIQPMEFTGKALILDELKRFRELQLNRLTMIDQAIAAMQGL